MLPILKWSGGKRSELPLLRPHFPTAPVRVIEPFSGGAAVAWDMEASATILNDLNTGLVAFYRMMKNARLRASTHHALKTIDAVRSRIRATFDELSPENIEAFYVDPAPQTSAWVEAWKKGLDLPAAVSRWETLALKSAQSKTRERIPRLEQQRSQAFTSEERGDHAQTALQSSWYELLREIQNGLHPVDLGWSNGAWWAVRTLCYSGMFRYSADGRLNVPYGGRDYNTRVLTSSIEDVFSPERVDFMRRTTIEGLDFEALFRRYDYFTAQDFVFVDPPYDSAFSKYNPEGDFTRSDQERLCRTLIACNAPWMLVIKDTPFIQDLYRTSGAFGYSFDKSYSVNFRNRHERAVTHLVITQKPLAPVGVNPVGLRTVFAPGL